MLPERIDRYTKAAGAIIKGITSPADAEFRQIVNTRLLQSEFGRFNPLPEDTLSEIAGTLKLRSGVTLSRLRNDLGIGRSEIMTLYGSFSDHHQIDRVEVFLPYAKGAKSLIEKMESRFKMDGVAFGISEQLNMALDISGNELTSAVLYLSLATRMLARNLDSRILGIKFSNQEIYLWKHRFLPFGYETDPEDTSGDIYHFWFNVLAGISREEEYGSDGGNRLKQFVCDITYPKTAMWSERLRHNLFLGVASWNTHEMIDRVGYNVGRALANKYAI